jgi:hypothetical protein
MRVRALARLVAASSLLAASWLLMVPPPDPSTGTLTTDFSAPLSQWAQFREFEHQSQCDEALSNYKLKPPGNFVDMLGAGMAAKTMQAAQCLPTSDPRLELQ